MRAGSPAAPSGTQAAANAAPAEASGGSALPQWPLALAAAAVLAVDPAGLGGAVLRAPAGPVRDRWLEALRRLLPAGAPWRRMPLHVNDGRLLGGLDLAATLKAGRPVAERGLLAEVDGGVLVLPMAERVSGATAARLTAALDAGEVRLERDGLRLRSPARFGVVALDEGEPDDERPAAGLLDRLALHLDLRQTSWRETYDDDLDAAAIAAARRRLPQVTAPARVVEALTAAAAALGIASLRAPLLALQAARAACALDGRAEVGDDDAAFAAQTVLAPRATVLPVPAEDAQEPEPPPESDQAPPDDGGQERDRPLDDVVLEAALAAVPPGLLAQLRAGSAARARAPATGRAGDWQPGRLRGRPAGTRRGELREGQRLNLIETLRAAAPWQPLRQRALPVEPVRVPAKGGGEPPLAGRFVAPARARPDGPVRARSEQPPHARWERIAPSRAAAAAPVDPAAGRAQSSGAAAPVRVLVRPEDFRIARYRQRAQTTSIFVVDASGSAALHRLAEAKGAVELLLADCYVRRDRVALVAFRGQGAELVLPPTRSLVRAKRLLAGLPGGGGTPLAAGIDAAVELAASLARRGDTPLLVVLTDGRANVARDGSGSRAAAQADALAAARAVRLAGFAALLIDTSPRPEPQAERLAAEMGARYLPLPHADAQAVSRAARAAAASG
jgi:magnesium chelatase subunit D